jgi:hypothetical protein
MPWLEPIVNSCVSLFGMMRGLTGFALAAGLAFAAWGAGCGGGSNGYGPGDDASTGGDGSETGTFGGDGATQGIDVEPQNQTIIATGPGKTQQFTARIAGAQVTAQWSIDAPTIGTIDPTGLFSASALAGGKVTVQAMAQGLTGQTALTVLLQISDNPGNVPANIQQQLVGGGNADAAFKWLYPYDATVFPRGLAAPTLQFAGTAPDAVYVHVSFAALDYKGFYAGSNPAQIDFAPQLWKTITDSASGTDDVKVDVTKISGGQVSGPITEKWHVAQGSLKGTVYYESRFSAASANGATMRIKPGAAQPDVLLGGCQVCHYVSADGSTLTATDMTGGLSASYDLTQNMTPPPVVQQETDASFAFGALYPNGSMVMGCASLAPTMASCNDWQPDIAGRVASSYPWPSHLYDTKTGAQIAAPGWDNTVSLALMPAFAPSGKQIAFNHYDTGMGHSIAVMGFDPSTKAFSGLVDVATDPNAYLAWPYFTPDSQFVVYHSGNRQDYVTWSAPQGGCANVVNGQADLAVAHVSSKTTALLDRLNGCDANHNCYLPYGEADEGHLNFDPTILPVAVGGYYWVVFTSRRDYGNTIDAATTPTPWYNGDNRSSGIPWRKKLWVAALDIDNPEHPSTSAHDISHPAFYLPGQDLQTGNYRGFWVLDPCKQMGSGCENGSECCSGYCRQQTDKDGAIDFVCVPPQGCSQEYEKCTQDSDCCQHSLGFHCIDGYCAQPTPM